MTPAEIAVIAGVNLAWGINVPVSKYLVSNIPPLMAAGLRMVLVMLFLLPWLRWVPGQMRMVALISVFLGIAQYGLLLAGFALSGEVSVVAIVMQIGIPFVTLVGYFQFRDRLNGQAWAGCGLAFAGVSLLTFDPRVFESYLSGVVLVSLASVAGVYGLALTRYLRDVPTFTVLAWSGVAGGITLPILSLALEPQAFTRTVEAPLLAWGGLLFTVVATSIAGQGGVTYLIKRHPVGIVMTLTLVSPVIAVLLGITLRDEQLTGRFLIGAVTALAGVALVATRNLRRS
jgi:O-acetylserine/cysteine efflux transporter